MFNLIKTLILGAIFHKTRQFGSKPHIFDAKTDQNQNQNQNSLLVKRQNDNTSPGDWPRKISPLFAKFKSEVMIRK